VHRTLSIHGKGLVPDGTMKIFHREVQASARQAGLLTDELIALVDACAARGVQIIPFMGPVLAVASYGDFSLREYVDLDLIVGQSSIPLARQLLWSRGYQLVEEAGLYGNEPGEGSLQSFMKKNGTFRVNLHCIMARRRFAFCLDREHFWNQLRPVWLGHRAVMSLAPEELLIVLCIHGTENAWKDLRFTCDVAELIRRRQVMDWARVSFLSRKWKCRRTVHMGLALAHTLFDAPLPRLIREKIETDSGILNLVKRMPKHLLRKEQEGVDEPNVDALYCTLKDSWVERWKYGVALCHAEVPIIAKAIPWFPFQQRLYILYRILRPLHRAAAYCVGFLGLKKILLKRLEVSADMPRWT
jgi:hypothetical protein